MASERKPHTLLSPLVSSKQARCQLSSAQIAQPSHLNAAVLFGAVQQVLAACISHITIHSTLSGGGERGQKGRWPSAC